MYLLTRSLARAGSILGIIFCASCILASRQLTISGPQVILPRQGSRWGRRNPRCRLGEPSRSFGGRLLKRVKGAERGNEYPPARGRDLGAIMQLNYAQLPEALEKLNRGSGDAGGAFRAHLRKLSAEGIPAGANPGKGRRVAYTVPLVIEATVAIELMQLGWSASQAAGLVRAHREDIIAATLLSLRPNTNPGQDVLIAVSSEALGTRPGGDRAGTVSFVIREKAGSLFSCRQPTSTPGGECWRWSLIDLATATLVTLGSIAHIGFPVAVAVEALEKAVEDYGARMEDFETAKLNNNLAEAVADGIANRRHP